MIIIFLYYYYYHCYSLSCYVLSLSSRIAYQTVIVSVDANETSKQVKKTRQNSENVQWQEILCYKSIKQLSSSITVKWRIKTPYSYLRRHYNLRLPLYYSHKWDKENKWNAVQNLGMFYALFPCNIIPSSNYWWEYSYFRPPAYNKSTAFVYILRIMCQSLPAVEELDKSLN